MFWRIAPLQRPGKTKVRGWRDERRLLEVGISMTGGGRRHTGLEKLEYDQGQHDATRDVLAVGSAGMLVRRDVWEDLKLILRRLGRPIP